MTGRAWTSHHSHRRVLSLRASVFPEDEAHPTYYWRLRVEPHRSINLEEGVELVRSACYILDTVGHHQACSSKEVFSRISDHVKQVGTLRTVLILRLRSKTTSRRLS